MRRIFKRILNSLLVGIFLFFITTTFYIDTSEAAPSPGAWTVLAPSSVSPNGYSVYDPYNSRYLYYDVYLFNNLDPFKDYQVSTRTNYEANPRTMLTTKSGSSNWPSSEDSYNCTGNYIVGQERVFTCLSHISFLTGIKVLQPVGNPAPQVLVRNPAEYSDVLVVPPMTLKNPTASMRVPYTTTTNTVTTTEFYTQFNLPQIKLVVTNFEKNYAGNDQIGISFDRYMNPSFNSNALAGAYGPSQPIFVVHAQMYDVNGNKITTGINNSWGGGNSLLQYGMFNYSSGLVLDRQTNISIFWNPAVKAKWVGITLGVGNNAGCGTYYGSSIFNFQTPSGSLIRKSGDILCSDTNYDLPTYMVLLKGLYNEPPTVTMNPVSANWFSLLTGSGVGVSWTTSDPDADSLTSNLYYNGNLVYSGNDWRSDYGNRQNNFLLNGLGSQYNIGQTGNSVYVSVSDGKNAVVWSNTVYFYINQNIPTKAISQQVWDSSKINHTVIIDNTILNNVGTTHNVLYELKGVLDANNLILTYITNGANKALLESILGSRVNVIVQ